MEKLQPFFSTIIRKMVRSLVRFYYAKVEVSGREQIPDFGPVLFVANHANSVIDPVIISIAARQPVCFLAKAPLFEVPVMGSLMRALGMLPAFRGSDDRSQVVGNLRSLSDAACILVKGESVGIFPEGKSHDAVKVDKIHSGASRIAVQAIQDGANDLKIIPIGINYERKERFRSSIWVRVGRPILLGEWKQQIAENEKAAQRALTAEINGRLKEVVVHLNEEKWEPFLEDLEALLPAEKKASRQPIAALRQRKRIADAINYFLSQDKPRAEKVAAEIQAHREELKAADLNMQSDLFRLRYTKLFLRQSWDFIWIVIGFIPALLGTLHNIVPFFAVRATVARIPQTNRSVVSLQKLLLSLPIYGLWYFLMWWKLSQYFLPWVATTWSFLMIFAGIFALAYCYKGKVAAQLWWSELRMLLQKENLQKLRASQFRLGKHIGELTDEYRQIHPVPTTGETPFPWSWWLTRVVSWGAVIFVFVFLGVWGFSKFRQHAIAELQFPGPDLTRLSAASFDAQLQADEMALRDIIKGLGQLDERALKIRSEFLAGQRNFYRQSDNDAIRQLLFSYLNYRAAIFRIIWKYQKYEDVRDESLRLRSFLVAYTSANVLCDASLKFITYFQDSKEAVRKLNEAEPLWGIPPGLFDTVQRNLALPQVRRQLSDAAKVYEKLKPTFAKEPSLNSAEYKIFHEAIRNSAENIPRLLATLQKNELAVSMEEARKVSGQAVYHTKSLVSEWIGDTKIREPREGKALIQPKQLEVLRNQLKPGDILLERRNWFLSNAFLPGYWPHSALYIGNAEDLKRLGLDKDPRVLKKWKEFAERDPQHHEHVIIESVSEGVIFSSLEHSIGGGDSAAVLRPRLSQNRVRESLARAFSHVGKPYDFEFDFFSSDKLVCTELVYRSYDGDIDFPLITILGTRTMPAIELVRKFSSERGRANAHLEFVAFLDGDEKKGRATFKNESDFVDTVNRPPLTWLQK